MKKKVKMTCILKSGGMITETIKVARKDSKVFRAIDTIRNDIETYLGQRGEGAGVITFGKTTIALSEIAAITFKD